MNDVNSVFDLSTGKGELVCRRRLHNTIAEQSAPVKFDHSQTVRIAVRLCSGNTNANSLDNCDCQFSLMYCCCVVFNCLRTAVVLASV